MSSISSVNPSLACRLRYFVFYRETGGWGRKGEGNDSQMYNFISISAANQTPGLHWVMSWIEKQKERDKRGETRGSMWWSAFLPKGYNRWYGMLLSLEPEWFKSLFYIIESIFNLTFDFPFATYPNCWLKRQLNTNLIFYIIFWWTPLNEVLHCKGHYDFHISRSRKNKHPTFNAYASWSPITNGWNFYTHKSFLRIKMHFFHRT